MVDVNRIRERAADWLGDVGERALRTVDDLVRPQRTPDEVREAWREWGRSVGAVPSEPRGSTAAPSYACGDSDCRMVGQEQNRAGACPACWRELDALPDEDAATDPSVEPASVDAGPWRGLEYDACLSPAQPDTWLVENVNALGETCYLARFYGPSAEERAREYAALMSAPLPCTPVLLVAQDRAADNGVWCDRHGGRFADAAPAPVEGIEMWFGQPSRDLAAAWNRHAGVSAKPAAAASGQRWICVGINGELEVCELRPALAGFSGFSGEIGLRPIGSAGPATVRAREVDMLGLKEWRFLG